MQFIFYLHFRLIDMYYRRDWRNRIRLCYYLCEKQLLLCGNIEQTMKALWVYSSYTETDGQQGLLQVSSYFLALEQELPSFSSKNSNGRSPCNHAHFFFYHWAWSKLNKCPSILNTTHCTKITAVICRTSKLSHTELLLQWFINKKDEHTP